MSVEKIRWANLYKMFKNFKRLAFISPFTYKHRVNTGPYHVLKHSIPCLQVVLRLRQVPLAGHSIWSVSQSAIVVWADAVKDLYSYLIS